MITKDVLDNIFCIKLKLCPHKAFNFLSNFLLKHFYDFKIKKSSVKEIVLTDLITSDADSHSFFLIRLSF